MKSEPLVSDFSMPSKIHVDKSLSQISPYGQIEPYKDGASQIFDNNELASSSKEIDFKISMTTGM